MLESHVPGNSQAWFGEGQLEKGHYTAPRWLPTPLRSGQIRLAEGPSLECDMNGASWHKATITSAFTKLDTGGEF
jgi:hypothetical protein